MDAENMICQHQVIFSFSPLILVLRRTFSAFCCVNGNFYENCAHTHPSATFKTTDLAFTDVTVWPIAVFSFTQMGPQTGRSQTGGLLDRSTTSIWTSTVRERTVSPRSSAMASRRQLSRQKERGVSSLVQLEGALGAYSRAVSVSIPRAMYHKVICQTKSNCIR